MYFLLILQVHGSLVKQAKLLCIGWLHITVFFFHLVSCVRYTHWIPTNSDSWEEALPIKNYLILWAQTRDLWLRMEQHCSLLYIIWWWIHIVVVSCYSLITPLLSIYYLKYTLFVHFYMSCCSYLTWHTFIIIYLNYFSKCIVATYSVCTVYWPGNCCFFTI